jgi:HSP20 family protein
MSVRDQALTISVNTPGRNYRKELQLPDSALVEGAKSSFNNGILEITFPKREGGSAGVRLKID